MENELQLFQNPDFGGVRGLMIDGGAVAGWKGRCPGAGVL